METVSASLALCAANSPVSGEFPAQRLTWRGALMFSLINKWLSKQPWGWWFETPSWSFWRHYNEIMKYVQTILANAILKDYNLFPVFSIVLLIFLLIFSFQDSHFFIMIIVISLETILKLFMQGETGTVYLMQSIFLLFSNENSSDIIRSNVVKFMRSYSDVFTLMYLAMFFFSQHLDNMVPSEWHLGNRSWNFSSNF